MWPRKSWRPLAGIVAVLAGICGESLKGETVHASGGISAVSAFSAQYKIQKDSLPSVTVALDHELKGRWAARGLYFNSQKSTFSGFALGACYGSMPTHVDNGALTNNGEHEIQVVPKWMWQGSAGLGVFRYLANLRRAAPRIGQNPVSAVDAQLYGVVMSAAVYRFLNDTYAISFDATEYASIASDFAVNSLSFSVGIAVQY